VLSLAEELDFEVIPRAEPQAQAQAHDQDQVRGRAHVGADTGAGADENERGERSEKERTTEKEKEKERTNEEEERQSEVDLSLVWVEALLRRCDKQREGYLTLGEFKQALRDPAFQPLRQFLQHICTSFGYHSTT
jgi:hypothetical protein